jgi:hypothetical protein
LKELLIISGIVASIGYPAANDKPAKFLSPVWNFPIKVDGSILMISFGKIAP